MNTLGHVVLAGSDPGLIAGGIIADGVKGRGALAALHPDVRAGVILHRAIDKWTDEDPAVVAACGLLRGRWGRLSPVLVDVFFDHALAANWGLVMPGTLRGHLDAVYPSIRAGAALLPADRGAGLERLVASDRLAGCGELDALAGPLERLAGRLRSARLSDPRPALEDFRGLRDPLFDCFLGCFPALHARATAWVRAAGVLPFPPPTCGEFPR